MTANLLTLNSSKMEFLLIGLQQQLTEIHNCSLNTTDSAQNLGFIFDGHLTFSNQISSLSKSRYYHIHELSCIHPYLNFKTASTIVTSVVHYGETSVRSIAPRSIAPGQKPPVFGHPRQTPPDEMPYAVKSPLGQIPPVKRLLIR